jgi:hypothetical protein
MLEPTAIEQMYRVYAKYKGYVYCDWYEVWEERQLTKEWVTRDYKAMDLIEIGCIHAVTALYPKKAWEQVEGFDETVSAWEDWDFMLKLANIGVCGTRVPVPLFVYRKERGQRREENYANFEESKASIYNKWKPFFEGKETLMGCNSCGGGGGVQLSASDFQQQVVNKMASSPPPESSEEYLIVEYVGEKQGVMSFQGPSGQRYQFSAIEQERQKYVRAEDAEWFAAKPTFRVRQPSNV